MISYRRLRGMEFEKGRQYAKEHGKILVIDHSSETAKLFPAPVSINLNEIRVRVQHGIITEVLSI